MPQNYVPIFIFILIVGTLLPITLAAGQAGTALESEQDQADAL